MEPEKRSFNFTCGILLPSALVIVGHISQRVWRGLWRDRHITAAETGRICVTIFWLCLCAVGLIIWGVLALIFDDDSSKSAGLPDH